MSNNNQNIPKIIHYCWFGKDKNGRPNPKPKIVLDCIESWKKHLADYQICEWTEEQFDPHSHPYTNMAYKNKKWAFVSDYVRVKAINDVGGIYLDTDMYILKDFDFLSNDLVLGREDRDNISSGMIASTKNNLYIKDLLQTFDTLQSLETIPKVMTRVWATNNHKYKDIRVKIFDPIYFYPFNSEEIKNFKYKNDTKDKNAWTHNAPTSSYGVHLWNYSWGHPANKFIKKIGLHKYIKITLEKIGLKKIIKKYMKMQ